MIQGRRLATLALLAACAGSVVAAQPAVGAPNPTKSHTTSAVIKLDAAGGYSIDMIDTLEQYKEFAPSGQWSFPDYLRLPDDPTHPVPGLLLPEFGTATANASGSPMTVTTARAGHAVAYQAKPTNQAIALKQTTTLTLPVHAATVIRGDRAFTYVRVPGAAPDVTISAAIPISQVYCSTYPPDMVPCGQVTDRSAHVGPTDHPGRGPEPRSDYSGLRVVVIERAAIDVKAETPRISYT